MTATLTQNLDKVRELAIDLRVGYPRSATEPLADYAIAARAVDKARADLLGWQGDYHYACPLTALFTTFAGIDVQELKDFVGTGATDAEISEWIKTKAIKRDRAEIIRWSNSWREKKLSELDDRLMVYMEDYVQECLPAESLHMIKTWFDIYDIEEKRVPLKP